jgi:Transposase IS4
MKMLRCMDEQLVGFRGHCPFRQYIKSKPARYGLKLWALCDSATSYSLNMQVYTGKKAGERAEKNQGERVVCHMIEVIKRSGRNVTTDNFLRPYH